MRTSNPAHTRRIGLFSKVGGHWPVTKPWNRQATVASEYKHGVSILNNSKYGFATVGNIMRLSLLRAPKPPDDTADMEHHSIRCFIMPHQGELGAETVRAAFNFNNPLKPVSASKESC